MVLLNGSQFHSLPLAAVGSLNGNITVYDVSAQKERCRCNAGVSICNTYVDLFLICSNTVKALYVVLY